MPHRDIPQKNIAGTLSLKARKIRQLYASGTQELF